VLPAPPPTLPAAPRAFYEAVRDLLAADPPPLLDAAGAEADFGDAGVAITLPHAQVEEWTLGAQVSRRAAVVFAGPVTAHFSQADGPEWPQAAAAQVGRLLRGEVAVEVPQRRLAFWRPARTETVRVRFTV
jgi:hypothetical protein